MLARVAFVAVPLFLGCVATAWAEEGPYPVRLNPRLGLESVDAAAIDARLNRPIPANESKLPPTDYVKYRDDWRTSELPLDELVEARVRPTNCTELNALLDAGYVPWDEPVYVDDCKALKLLRRARPSRVSYVRSFVMSAEAVDVLPAMIANGALFSRLCDEYIANKKRTPWSAFDNIVDVDVVGELAMFVKAQHPETRHDTGVAVFVGGGRTRIEILAWGDFDGDGVEDLLFDSSSYPIDWDLTEGVSSAAQNSYGDIYILSRQSPDAVLHVIEPESHLSPKLLYFEPCVYP